MPCVSERAHEPYRVLVDAGVAILRQGWKWANPTFIDRRGFECYYTTQWADTPEECFESHRILSGLANALDTSHKSPGTKERMP